MTTAVITGASAGIGLATAELFLQKGTKVVNLSRRPCPIPEVHSIPTDLSNPDFIDELSSELVPLLGDPSDGDGSTVHLIHNASRLLNDTATATDDSILRDVLQVNLIATNSLNRLLIANMKTGSSIVYVGSTLSEKAVPSSFTYVTSKHAQIGAMRSLCQDLAKSGIHTAAVCPGFTNTEMLRDHVPAENLASIAALNAFQRLIDPKEIAQLIVWASENPVVNGSVLHANLGQIER